MTSNEELTRSMPPDLGAYLVAPGPFVRVRRVKQANRAFRERTPDPGTGHTGDNHPPTG